MRSLPTRRPTAWTISLGVHVLLLAAFALALDGISRRERPAPARLVYVEPAPLGAAPAQHGDVAPPSAPAAPPADVTEHPPPRLTVARERRRRDMPHPPPRPPATVPQPAPAEHVDVFAATGPALGSAGGVEGGAIGGLGEAPLPVRDVAAPPELIRRVVPDYPPRARAMQVEGQVVLEIVVDRSGRVEDAIRVTHSLAMLDAAAVTAVRQWQFRPGRGPDGRPVRVLMEVPVRFVLR